MLLEQDTQLRSSRVYADNLTPGAALETPSPPVMESDLNALRSQINLMLRGSGVGKWYDALSNAFGLREIHDKIIAFQMPVIPGTEDFTLGAAAAGVLLDASKFSGGSGIIAVGSASTADGGYIAAAEPLFTLAGVLGVGLTAIYDLDSVLLNRASLLDAATNDHPETPGGEQIFGLVQCIAGTADGAAIGVAGSENLQLSFVYIAKGTDVITATTLPAGSYHFGPPRQRNFYGLNRGALLSGGALPSIIDPGSQLARAPFKEFDITAGGNIAAGDPLNLTTGIFTAAGARTSLIASYGTIALPASGAAFQVDERIVCYRNGQFQSRGPGAGTPRDWYWVSATQIAFSVVLKQAEVLYFRMPSAY